jgi:hypothetical protein
MATNVPYPTEAEMAYFEHRTCNHCGHWLKADDRRYGQCMDCGKDLLPSQLKLKRRPRS